MSVMSKFESKQSKSLDFIAYSVFKKFYLEEFYSTSNPASQNGHKFWTQLSTSIEFCKNMPYLYILKVTKFWVCPFLRLVSIEENIEGDANLNHPPRNRVNPIIKIYIRWGIIFKPFHLFSNNIIHKIRNFS